MSRDLSQLGEDVKRFVAVGEDVKRFVAVRRGCQEIFRGLRNSAKDFSRFDKTLQFVIENRDYNSLRFCEQGLKIHFLPNVEWFCD